VVSDMEEWGMLNELGTRDRSQSVHIAPLLLALRVLL
jgi:hypothetical protein